MCSPPPVESGASTEQLGTRLMDRAALLDGSNDRAYTESTGAMGEFNPFEEHLPGGMGVSEY